MWHLPGPGIKPVSPALAGGFLTTAPPGKSSLLDFRSYSLHPAKLETWEAQLSKSWCLSWRGSQNRTGNKISVVTISWWSVLVVPKCQCEDLCCPTSVCRKEKRNFFIKLHVFNLRNCPLLCKWFLSMMLECSYDRRLREDGERFFKLLYLAN